MKTFITIDTQCFNLKYIYINGYFNTSYLGIHTLDLYEIINIFIYNIIVKMFCLYISIIYKLLNVML